MPLKDIPKRNGESRAAGIGLMGGVAAAAYLDLIIRFCPRGLQGTTLMVSGSLFFVASRFDDVRERIFMTITAACCLYDRDPGCVRPDPPDTPAGAPNLTATTDGQTPEPGFAAD
jgi:hypothetical protein